MKYTCVMPWVVWDWRWACLETCKIDVCDVDNSLVNRGVPRSWNMGVDEMRRTDSDWLIVMSAAIRFGDAGGTDFVRTLEEHPDHGVISALNTFGWHLIAFSRETIEMAGRFDENFFPGYYEDIDYAIRMHHTQGTKLWGAYECDVTDAGMSHALRKTRIPIDNQALITYFISKWQVNPGCDWHQYADHPFLNKNNPIGYWPQSPHTNGVWDQPAPEAL